MKGPDKVYGPLIANLMQKLAMEIKKETGATGIRIACEFTFEGDHGDLKLQTFTTPDAKTERLLDQDNPLPRGSKLQYDVASKLRAAITNIIKTLGGK